MVLTENELTKMVIESAIEVLEEKVGELEESKNQVTEALGEYRTYYETL